MCPKRLFRFSKPTFATSLAHTGSIRIGTLSEFRRAEKYAAGISDEGEGSNVIDIDHFETAEFPHASRLEQEAIKRNVGPFLDSLGVNPSAIIGIQVQETAADCNILCTSLACTTALQRTFGEGCVEIANPPAFVKAIAAALLHKLGASIRITVGACSYSRKPTNYRRNPGSRRDWSPFYKPESLADQHEFRIVLAGAIPVEHHILEIPELTSYCRQLSQSEIEALEIETNAGRLGSAAYAASVSPEMDVPPPTEGSEQLRLALAMSLHRPKVPRKPPPPSRYKQRKRRQS